MKKWIFAAVLCGSFGCAKQEPGQPMQFAPGAPAESEADEESAPIEAPAEAAPAKERRDAVEGDDEAFGGADVPAAAAADDLDDDMKRDRAVAKPTAAPARAQKIGDIATTCDSACKKACAGAADQNVCAQAYAAGCFSGTAPATFDCGGNGVKGKAKPNGVEAKGLPVSIP